MPVLSNFLDVLARPGRFFFAPLSLAWHIIDLITPTIIYYYTIKSRLFNIMR